MLAFSCLSISISPPHTLTLFISDLFTFCFHFEIDKTKLQAPRLSAAFATTIKLHAKRIYETQLDERLKFA